MGPGILPETTVGKHNLPCHLQMQTKALSCKKEAKSEHGPEAPSCPVVQGSFKMDCFKVEKCSMVRQVQFGILVGSHGRCVLRAKEEGDLPACHQRLVQKPASLMVWGCVSAYGVGSLHVLEGTMNAEMYIKVLEQHMLPSRRRVFQQDNAKPHTAAITTAWLRSRRVRVLNWPAFSPDLSPIQNICGITSKMTTNSLAAGNLYQARMGPNSSTKTPETHNLDAQMSSNCFEKKRRCYTMVNMPSSQLF